MNVFENYAKNIENNYKVLKPLKVQSSLGGVKIPKIQNFFMNGLNNKNENVFEDIDLGDDDSDNLDEEDIDNTTYNATYSNNKISISAKNNIQIYNLNKKKKKIKDTSDKIREEINKLTRANSK